MKGGFGTASVKLPSGLVIGAAVAVNAVGEIRHPGRGGTAAGARGDEPGSFLEPLRYLPGLDNPFAAVKPVTNTTIARRLQRQSDEDGDEQGGGDGA
ncbi:hypothetical protein J6TS7_09760 [Paenibacillus dendritiformis]|nr:hypothetical protein J6TS7_09760 [Paenibacillus dendritiformis]